MPGQDTAGRGSHSRCAQWLLLFISWLTRVKVEFLYLFFICFFLPHPYPKCYIKGSFRGWNKFKGRKQQLLFKKMKKIIQFGPGRVVFAINLQSSLSWNFDYAGIRQATDCGLSPSSPLSSLLPPAANRKQMSLILRGMAILPFFSSQLTISWEAGKR